MKGVSAVPPADMTRTRRGRRATTTRARSGATTTTRARSRSDDDEGAQQGRRRRGRAAGRGRRGRAAERRRAGARRPRRRARPAGSRAGQGSASGVGTAARPAPAGQRVRRRHGSASGVVVAGDSGTGAGCSVPTSRRFEGAQSGGRRCAAWPCSLPRGENKAIAVRTEQRTTKRKLPRSLACSWRVCGGGRRRGRRAGDGRERGEGEEGKAGYAAVTSSSRPHLFFVACWARPAVGRASAPTRPQKKRALLNALTHNCALRCVTNCRAALLLLHSFFPRRFSAQGRGWSPFFPRRRTACVRTRTRS